KLGKISLLRFSCARPSASEVHPEIWIRHCRAEECCMSTEPVLVDSGTDVGVRSLLKQPPCNVELIVLDANVKKCRAIDRRTWEHLVITARLELLALQLGWINLRPRECSLQKIRITLHVSLEQIESSAMQRHHRRIGQLESMLYVQLQNLVLCLGIPGVRLEHDVCRRIWFSICVDQLSTDLEQILRCLDLECVSRAAECPGRRLGRSQQLVNELRCFDSSLQNSTIEGFLQVFSTK